MEEWRKGEGKSVSQGSFKGRNGKRRERELKSICIEIEKVLYTCVYIYLFIFWVFCDNVISFYYFLKIYIVLV